MRYQYLGFEPQGHGKYPIGCPDEYMVIIGIDFKVASPPPESVGCEHELRWVNNTPSYTDLPWFQVGESNLYEQSDLALLVEDGTVFSKVLLYYSIVPSPILITCHSPYSTVLSSAFWS